MGVGRGITRRRSHGHRARFPPPRRYAKWSGGGGRPYMASVRGGGVGRRPGRGRTRTRRRSAQSGARSPWLGRTQRRSGGGRTRRPCAAEVSDGGSSAAVSAEVVPAWSEVSPAAAVRGGGRAVAVRCGRARRMCVADVSSDGPAAAVRGGGRPGAARGFPGRGRTRRRTGVGCRRRLCAAEVGRRRSYTAAVRSGGAGRRPGRGRTRQRSAVRGARFPLPRPYVAACATEVPGGCLAAAVRGGGRPGAA